MRYIKIIIGLLFLCLFLVFAGQNNNLVEFHFLTLKISQIPLFVIIITVFVVGFILGRISGWFIYLFESKPKKQKDS